MPDMDYTLLRGRIRDCGLTQKELAEKAGISEGQFCQKLAGNYVFRPHLRPVEHPAHGHRSVFLFAEKVVI